VKEAATNAFLDGLISIVMSIYPSPGKTAPC